jgi:hypothetical protein
MSPAAARVRHAVAGTILASLVGLLGAACGAGTEGPEATESPDATAGPDATTDGTDEPEVIPLPDGFQPEGVAAGLGGELFVGSLRDGDIWRGDVGTGEGSVLVDAPADRVAVGLAFDEANRWVFVAGGPTGQAFVYDSETGDEVAATELTTSDDTFINDVALTSERAWFTDSRRGVLYAVPVAEDGTLGPVETLELRGPASDAAGQFNLNGIAATADGSRLVVAHSALEKVMVVDPGTGESSIIDVGADLPNGDGILLEDSRLWVVQNFLNQVSEISLAEDPSTGEIVSVLTTEKFRIPTTIARVDDRLVVVNARFDLQDPAPTDEYELVVLAR